MPDDKTTTECPDCGIEMLADNDGVIRCAYCNPWAFRDAVSDGAIYASVPRKTAPQPIDRRLSEAMAAYLLGHPGGYDLPPLGIMLKQMKSALAAADAVPVEPMSDKTPANNVEKVRIAFGDALCTKVSLKTPLGKIPVHLLREAMAEALEAVKDV